MRPGTPVEKYDRLKAILQNLWLKAYPNPDRVGCPGGRAAENLAKRTSDVKYDPSGEPEYQHVMQCSPCYAEYLAATRELRGISTEDGKPPSSRARREFARTVDQLEEVLIMCANTRARE